MAFIDEYDLDMIFPNINFSEPLKIDKEVKKIQPTLEIKPLPHEKIEKLIMKISSLLKNNMLEKSKFSLKEIKLIPFTFYYNFNGAKFIDFYEITQKLLSLINKPSPLILTRLIKEYLQNFENTASDNLIKAFLYEKLKTNNSSKILIKKWKENINYFFSSSSFENLIELISTNSNVLSTLESVNIDRQLFNSKFIRFLSIKFSEKLRNGFSKEDLDKFFQLIYNNETLRFNDIDFLSQIASNIIPNTPSELKDRTYNFFLENLGNPLLVSNKFNW